jgi:hypothetical protein
MILASPTPTLMKTFAKSANQFSVPTQPFMLPQCTQYMPPQFIMLLPYMLPL